MNKPYGYLPLFNLADLTLARRLWHTQQSNVDRSNAIIKRFAAIFKDMTGVVPIIAPLNE